MAAPKSKFKRANNADDDAVDDGEMLTQVPSPSVALEGRSRLFGLASDTPDFAEIDVAEIRASPNQARRAFDADAIKSLADSIARHGQQQPIVVRRTGDGYELIAGERRLRAHQLLNRATIFALVTRKDADAGELSLIENVQRVDLNAMELANGLRQLMEKGCYTQVRAGEIVGLSDKVVSRLLGLLSLPDYIKAEYPAVADVVSRSTMMELVDIDDSTILQSVWALAKSGGLRREELREAVKDSKKKASGDVASPDSDVKGLRRSVNAIKANVLSLEARKNQLPDGERRTLRELRDRIDRLLGD